jgi:Transposase DDE domain
MSTTIPELTTLMQDILLTQAAATERSSGFVQRRSKLTGPLFAQTLVFGWWTQPAATLEDLADTAALLGCDLSPQALADRFTPAAATFLRGLLEATLAQATTAAPVALALLRRFAAVLVADGTVITLPTSLTEIWPGCGHAAGATAALKLLLELDLLQGGVAGVLTAGRVADRTAAAALPPAPTGCLRLRDLGFFNIRHFAAWDAVGDFWLSRLGMQASVLDLDGQELDLPTWLAAQSAETGERRILLGRAEQVRCRLIWQRVPPIVAEARRAALLQEAVRRGVPVSVRGWTLAGWTLLLTNTTSAQLSIAEALVLLRARWEVELLFKRWKSLGQVDEWRSRKPWRVLCEVYAKLLGLVLQHRVIAAGSWQHAERSLWRLGRRLQRYGLLLASAWGQPRCVRRVLRQMVRVVGRRYAITQRATEPALYQLLQDPGLLPTKQAATVARLRQAQERERSPRPQPLAA